MLGSLILPWVFLMCLLFSPTANTVNLKAMGHQDKWQPDVLDKLMVLHMSCYSAEAQNVLFYCKIIPVSANSISCYNKIFGRRWWSHLTWKLLGWRLIQKISRGFYICRWLYKRRLTRQGSQSFFTGFHDNFLSEQLSLSIHLCLQFNCQFSLLLFFGNWHQLRLFHIVPIYTALIYPVMSRWWGCLLHPLPFPSCECDQFLSK